MYACLFAEQLPGAAEPAGYRHQQWCSFTFFWPRHWSCLPLRQGWTKDDWTTVCLCVTRPNWLVCSNTGHRGTAVSVTLRWPMKHPMSTTSPCTAAKRARKAWATCPREVWKSTNVKSPGKQSELEEGVALVVSLHSVYKPFQTERLQS